MLIYRLGELSRLIPVVVSYRDCLSFQIEICINTPEGCRINMINFCDAEERKVFKCVEKIHIFFGSFWEDKSCTTKKLLYKHINRKKINIVTLHASSLRQMCFWFFYVISKSIQ